MMEKKTEESEAEANKKRNIEEVLKLTGTAKGAKPFKRDKTDRTDRY